MLLYHSSCSFFALPCFLLRECVHSTRLQASMLCIFKSCHLIFYTLDSTKVLCEYFKCFFLSLLSRSYQYGESLVVCRILSPTNARFVYLSYCYIHYYYFLFYCSFIYLICLIVKIIPHISF